jgi:hypothetical protein
MKRSSFLVNLVFLLCFYGCSSKKISVSLRPSYNINNVVRVTLENNEFDNKLPIVLVNNDTLRRYISDRFEIVSKCSSGDTSLRIGILIGLIDSNKIVVVPDSDFNGHFTNDSVYTVFLSNSVSSREAFINLFPIISILVKNTSKKIPIVHGFSFKVYPESNDRKFGFYSRDKNLVNIRNGSITFVVLKSYEGKRKIKGNYFFFSFR